MPILGRFGSYRTAILIALTVLAGDGAISAQETVQRPPAATEDVPRVEQPEVVIEEITPAEEPTADAAQPSEMEEIIVIAPKPGDRRRVDEEFEDPVRARILKDFYRMQELEEEYEWRRAGAEDSRSRIKLGYDPRDDYRMRNEMALQDLSWEKTKPATIFKFEF